MHYKFAETEALVELYIRATGSEFAIIEHACRLFYVPHHYVALHGIEGKTAEDFERLGFRELRVRAC